MDPLSFTANIIAVVSAASKVSEGFRGILSVREAPQEILQFMNEISDFRAVITLAQETFRHLIDDENSQEIHELSARMNGRLSNAMVILNDLNEMINDCVLISQSTSTAAGIRISKREWLLRNKQIRRLLASLRATRSYISEGLNILTASGVPQVRVNLRGVVLDSQHLSTAMQNLERGTSSQISDIEPKLQAIHSTLRNTRSLVEASRTNSNDPISPTFQIQTSIYGKSKCDRLCMCQCHQNFTLKSPGWIKEFVGALLLGYHGTQFWYRQPCNERLCQKEQTCLLNVAYIFPTWFLRRMVFLRNSWTPTHGNLISIRTPRVVENVDQPVFIHSSMGHIESLQTLFSEGKASPFDVTSTFFQSPLHTAIGGRRLDVCELLLSQHADPELEDIFHRSTVHMVWDEILSSPNEPFTLGLRKIFDKFLDVNDTLQDRKFTILHQIILGLSPISLAAQLRVSTSDIDAQCSNGWTPLYWAVRRNDPDAVQTLVNFGASLHVANMADENPMHLAARWSSKSLRILLSAAAAIDSSMNPSNYRLLGNSLVTSKGPYIESLIDCPAKYHLNPLQLASAFDATGESTAILLEYSADANKGPECSPLLFAIQYNNHAALKHLLARGADLNAKDVEDMGVLHVAAAGDMKTLKILLSFDVRVEGSKDKDIFGHTPLEVFDLVRSTMRTEDDHTRERCREIFLEILSRQDPNPTIEELAETKGSDVALVDDDSDVFYDCEEVIGMDNLAHEMRELEALKI